jgi:hypothetical protein
MREIVEWNLGVAEWVVAAIPGISAYQAVILVFSFAASFFERTDFVGVEEYLTVRADDIGTERVNYFHLPADK